MDTSTSLGDFPRQTRTQASLAAKPSTTAPRSVFDIARAAEDQQAEALKAELQKIEAKKVEAKKAEVTKRKSPRNPPNITKVQMIDGPPPAKSVIFSRDSAYAELYTRLAVDKGALLTIRQARSMAQWSRKFGKKVTVRILPSHGADVAGVWLAAD